MPKSPKALSLFSGAGGMDIGIKNSGFYVPACVEMDRFACETLRWNNEIKNKSSKIIEADIRGINPTTLADDLKIKKRDLSLLFGGLPLIEAARRKYRLRDVARWDYNRVCLLKNHTSVPE